MFVTLEIGDHQLDVTFDNLSLTPLPFQVTASDGYDLSKVNVSGPGLKMLIFILKLQSVG